MKSSSVTHPPQGLVFFDNFLLNMVLKCAYLFYSKFSVGSDELDKTSFDHLMFFLYFSPFCVHILAISKLQQPGHG